MKEAELTKQESSQLLRHSMASLMVEVPGITLDKKHQTNYIGFGDLFEETGYGFIGGRASTKCEYNILI